MHSINQSSITVLRWLPSFADGLIRVLDLHWRFQHLDTFENHTIRALTDIERIA
jgi:hypothetical protein